MDKWMGGWIDSRAIGGLRGAESGADKDSVCNIWNWRVECDEVVVCVCVCGWVLQKWAEQKHTLEHTQT